MKVHVHTQVQKKSHQASHKELSSESLLFLVYITDMPEKSSCTTRLFAWNLRVDITAKRATTSLKFLKRNLSSFPSTVKERCYKSLVRPIMVYASCVWDPHTKRNTQPRVMIQRIAARFVKGIYSTVSSVAAMLADLQWNTLHQRRMQSKTVMLYIVVHQSIAIPITAFLISARVSRGHSMKIAIPQSSVNVHLYSFFPSGIRNWNQFPQSAVSAPSLEAFRDQLPFSSLLM